MRYSYHSSKIELRSGAKQGIGLFATAPIAKGELLVTTGGRILNLEELKTYEKPGHPFQIERELQLAPIDINFLDGIFAVNHSCTPNAGIRAQASLVALHAIAAHEEICYDYVMTDSDPHGEETIRMKCLCNTPGCREWITDLDWRNQKLQIRYQGYFSHYLQERIQGLS